MSTIMLSIQNRFIEKIKTKEKKYEFRKSFPKESINKILIYNPSPISKIVGEIEVEQIIIDLSDIKNLEIDEETLKYLPNYYKKSQKAYIYKIISFKEYIEYKAINDYDFKSPPQNFYYIKE